MLNSILIFNNHHELYLEEKSFFSAVFINLHIKSGKLELGAQSQIETGTKSSQYTDG